ncbi:MAG: DUF523 domain-containing protein [Planctomycetota bacterium]|nr:MAG: DUF523 domain-containing protein [Planctomycetota bacterium]
MANQLPPDLQAGDRVLVSACVLGEATRYDGDSNPMPALIQALQEAGIECISVCPEVLGGLSTPRPPAQMEWGTGEEVWQGRSQVKTAQGEMVTSQFLAGAEKTLALAKAYGARHAFLKERSPSCGRFHTHSGGQLVAGPGVTTAALIEAGLQVHAADAWVV